MLQYLSKLIRRHLSQKSTQTAPKFVTFSKRVALVWSASLFGAGAASITQLMLAKHLAVAELGLFSSMLAIMALAVPVAGFGVPSFLLQLHGSDPLALHRWRKQVRKTVLASQASVLVTLVVAAFFINQRESHEIVVFALLSLFVPAQVSIELLSSKLKAFEQVGSLSALQFLPQLARLTAVVLAYLISSGSFSVVSAALAYAVASTVMLIWSASLEHNSHKTHFEGVVSEEASADSFWVASRSWPFMLAALCHIVYFQSNVVILRFIGGDREAGLYALAFTLISLTYVLPGVIYQRLLQSDMHRWAYHDPKKLVKAYRIGNWLMAAAGFLCSLGLAAFALWGLVWVFGDRYEDAVPVVLVLCLAVPLRFVSNSAGAVLSTGNNVRTKLIIMLVVAIVSVPLNLIMARGFGAVGGASALVLCEGLLLLMFLRGANRALLNAESN